MHTDHNLDMQSVQGTLLSVLFIVLGQLFEMLSFLDILQGCAYSATILIAIDTLTSNKLKKYITTKLNNYADKSKRSRLDKEV